MRYHYALRHITIFCFIKIVACFIPNSTISFVLRIAESFTSISNYTRAAAMVESGDRRSAVRARDGSGRAGHWSGHLGPRDIQPMLCSVAVRSAALSLFPRPFNPGIGRRWRNHTVGGARRRRTTAVRGPSLDQLPAGCQRVQRVAGAPQAVPSRFACLRPAAGSCSLFIDSSQRAWGSRHQSAPEQPRLDPR